MRSFINALEIPLRILRPEVIVVGPWLGLHLLLLPPHLLLLTLLALHLLPAEVEKVLRILVIVDDELGAVLGRTQQRVIGGPQVNLKK